jgi:hypothetical protein
MLQIMRWDRHKSPQARAAGRCAMITNCGNEGFADEPVPAVRRGLGSLIQVSLGTA